MIPKWKGATLAILLAYIIILASFSGNDQKFNFLQYGPCKTLLKLGSIVWRETCKERKALWTQKLWMPWDEFLCLSVSELSNRAINSPKMTLILNYFKYNLRLIKPRRKCILPWLRFLKILKNKEVRSIMRPSLVIDCRD